ncbi:MAG: Glyoxalase/Bleomycin resistance protein/Dioxygenase superfamily [Porphyrobacter sp. HL-46]|nr:MAG: Glyoxalase/Bleomycin resistance protein/Dioxygenase superfamily [Porphyrobacter sp. HL-46]
MPAVRQLAYKVNDLEAAAATHHRHFGSGPFFVLDHVPLASSQHRGVERPFDHSSAYGQWGSVMVELVVQHNPDPSALHDMFPHGSGAQGLHHAALFVDDLDRAIARFAAEGSPLAQLSVTVGGTAFASLPLSIRARTSGICWNCTSRPGSLAASMTLWRTRRRIGMDGI